MISAVAAYLVAATVTTVAYTALARVAHRRRQPPMVRRTYRAGSAHHG